MTTSKAQNPQIAPPALIELPRTQIEALLQETRQEIARTDAKASVLIALLSVLTATIGALGVGHPLPTSLRWTTWPLVAIDATSILLLLRAVRPRMGTGSIGRQEYFAHFARYAGRSQSLEQELVGTPRELESRKVAQLIDLSQLVVRKYSLIRIAVDLFSVSTLLATAGILLETLKR